LKIENYFMLVHIKDIVKKAEQGSYAIGAFNIVTLESVLGVAQAAVKSGSPAIIQVSESAVQYMGLKPITHIVSTVAKNVAASAPVVRLGRTVRSYIFHRCVFDEAPMKTLLVLVGWCLLFVLCWPLALLALPPAFYVWSIHSSGTPLYVPVLWPFSFYNTRYAVAALPLLWFSQVIFPIRCVLRYIANGILGLLRRGGLLAVAIPPSKSRKVEIDVRWIRYGQMVLAGLVAPYGHV
jgi:hypothetical protein